MTTITIVNGSSPRWMVLRGMGIRARLASWHVPCVASPTHGGASVRSGHLPDVRALCDLHGVRLVDRREAS